MNARLLAMWLGACGEPSARATSTKPNCDQSCMGSFDAQRPPRLPTGFGFAYRHCASWHVVDTPGDQPIATDDLVAFKDRHGLALVGPGPGASIGIGGCCASEPGTPNVVCLSALINPCKVSMESVIERLVTALRRDGLSRARVTIELQFSFCNPTLL